MKTKFPTRHHAFPTNVSLIDFILGIQCFIQEGDYYGSN